jgi:dipeptidyl aminopeptidase/acylaminoacyl peptidase
MMKSFEGPSARIVLAVALFSILLLAGGPAYGQTRGYDPVTEDPPTVDYQHPATALETGFDVQGSHLNATFFLAQGAGRHPNVVLLHGFPGYDKHFDLAHAMRRAGWNVLIFHYRGAWGSGGSFSIPNALEDVSAAIDWVKGLAVENERIDPENVVVVGHSLGGFLSLMTAASHPSLRCAASLAGVNLGRGGKALRENAAGRAERVAWLDNLAGPLAGFSGAVMVEDMMNHAEKWDFLQRIDALSKHRLLLVAGTRDEVVPIEDNHRPLMAALGKAGGDVTEVILDADHGYSDKRIALTRALVSWLESRCQ